MNPTYDFHGQVALVTGAASGMGLATARGFAAAGAAVALADLPGDALQTAAEGLKAEGHRVMAIGTDVSDEAQAAAMVARTVAAVGRLDMAYNNPINLRGVWTCMKHELLHMRKQGSGAIVNCSSLGGLVGLAGRAAYHGSKHGVIGLTKSAAMDYAAQGIRINAVCPGCIDTPMGAGIDPDAMARFLEDQPIGRMGRPEEVAACVLWLCSPGASLVLGVALPVDGGFTAH
jgi:NAD(P)-dependent dehydrogenase (short-subunit alcohol dehydrogenase family)